MVSDQGAMRKMLGEIMEVELSGDELDWYTELVRASWQEIHEMATKEAQRAARTPSLQCSLEHLLRGRAIEAGPSTVPPPAPEPPSGITLKRWRTTRATLRGTAENEDERARAETEEQSRWITSALEVLEMIAAPSLRDAAGERRDPKLLRHLFGKRRASTLRARTRYMKA